ncbi:MAG: serine acetyltransferase [Candidatus Bathyarchaeota archaeon]|nr:MAG: serine acetyltransferase [Candidatus Bathyarchaeota archaeon]
MLELLLKEQETSSENWIENGLPKLVQEIVASYGNRGQIHHLEGKDLPTKQNVIGILEDLLAIVFPGYLSTTPVTKANTTYFVGDLLHSIYYRLIDEIDKSLKYLCRRIEECPADICLRRAHIVVKEFLEQLPFIRSLVEGDIQAAYEGDPAATSTDEVILSYPCTLAITTYRLAHELYTRGVPFVPRIMTEYAHSQTGVDIHPGAKIGNNFFIDHGTGVVIGETAEIGNNVKIYQSVTLGALSFPYDTDGKIIKGTKRHPTVGNHVVIYSGATILGGDTVIGDDAIIGGNVWITSSIPASTQVTIVPSQHRYNNQNSHLDSIPSEKNEEQHEILKKQKKEG